MKKKIFNAAELATIRKSIKNSLDEEGARLRDALLDLISEMEDATDEFSADDLENAIRDRFEQFKGEQEQAIAEEVANAVARRIKETANAVNKELPLAIRNKVAGAILKSTDRSKVEDNVNRILTENGITGYTFNDVIDFAVVEKWGDHNELYRQFYQTMYSKFFYNEDTLMTSKNILAKQWGSPDVAEKVIQEIELTGKTINTAYVYKRQQVAFADLDEIQIAGEESRFLAWISEELDRQIVNTIVMAILLGDTVNDVDNRLTTFETIAKVTSDAFTTVSTEAGATPTIEEVRTLCDNVADPYGYGKVLIMSGATLTALSEFIYASGGSTSYKSKEEMAQQFGVRDIITLDMMSASATVDAICLVPQEYWIREKKYQNFVYPTYEKNVVNYQKERNIGGAIHGLLSTAVLLKGE